MTALIALAAICLAAAGAAAGLTGVVAVAIRREGRNLTLTSQAPGTVTRAARRLTGLHVRAPAGDQEWPDDVVAASTLAKVAASGAFASLSTTKLLTVEEMLAALRGAGGVDYHAPGAPR